MNNQTTLVENQDTPIVNLQTATIPEAHFFQVDHIYILILDKNRKKKRDLIKERLNKLSYIKYASFELFSAFDGRENPDIRQHEISLYPNWKIESTNSWYNRKMTPGEIGCSISHYLIWKDAESKGYERILILEEDFEPLELTKKVLELPAKTWDLFYLGRSIIGQDKNINDDFVIPGYSYCTHAYILSKNGLNALLNSGFDKNLIPVDEFLTAIHNEHPRQDILNVFKPKISAISFVSEVIKQDKTEPSTTEIDPLFADYRPICPQLFEAYGGSLPQWIERYLNPQLVAGEYELICDEVIDNVFVFPLFTSQFCKELIAEAENYGNWTTNRHKSYPTYDMLLGDFGFNDIYAYVLKKYVYPLCIAKYQLGGSLWEKLKSENFIVRYSPDNQSHLGIHHDGCLISLILTLNNEFEGGGTFYPKFKTLVNPKIPGYVCVHPGPVGYKHGARPVTSGKRYIVASFLYHKERIIAEVEE